MGPGFQWTVYPQVVHHITHGYCLAHDRDIVVFDIDLHVARIDFLGCELVHVHGRSGYCTHSYIVVCTAYEARIGIDLYSLLLAS